MKEDNSYESAKEAFTAYLVKHNHRKTSERYAILERIYAYDGHFSAEYLYQSMQNEYRVSLATVYNTLELLLQCQLVIKHQFGNQQAQYEKVFGNGLHHHLICTNCGKVKEFSDKGIRIAIQSKRFASFDTLHYSLYVYGLCNKCKQEKKQKNK